MDREADRNVEPGAAAGSPRGPILSMRRLVVLLAIVCLARTAQVYYAGYDSDEYQYLHAAWEVGEGRLPYRDFWENHTPLMFYGISSLIRPSGRTPHLLFLVRAALLPVFAVTAWLVYRVARLRFERNQAVLACVLFVGAYSSLTVATEVRAEVPLQTLWMLSLWLFLRPKLRGRLWQYFASGLALGVGVQFAPTGLFDVTALAVAIVALLIRPVGQVRRGRMFRAGVAVAVGVLVPTVAAVAIFARLGVLGAYLDQCLLGNLNYPDHHRFGVVRTSTAPLFVAAGVGLLLSARSLLWGPREQAKAFDATVSLATVALLVIVLFLAPATYSQVAVHYTPLFCLPAVMALGWLAQVRWPHARKLTVAAIGLMIALPLVDCLPIGTGADGKTRELQYAGPRTTLDHIERTRRILELTRPDETVLDGRGTAIYRRNASFHTSLVTGVTRRMRTDAALRAEMVAAVERSDWVLRDRRIRRLPEKVLRRIDELFVRCPKANDAVFARDHLLWRRDRGLRGGRDASR